MVVGGQAADGRWFQVFLWRRGVPLWLGPTPYDSTGRLLGRALHLLRHRGDYLVVVRLDPERRRIVSAGNAFRNEQFWRYGPWSKQTAKVRKTELARAIDHGWDPRSDPAGPPGSDGSSDSALA